MTQENVQPVEELPVAAPVVEAPVVESNDDIEIIEDTDTSDVELDTAEPEAKQFDPRTDKVDFSTPEQQEKFNHVYKQMKMSDARNQMQLDMLQKQQQRLDELENRFRKEDSADAEGMLLQKIKFARDSGDDAAEIAAINELTDFKVEKKLSEKVNKPAPQQQSNVQDVESTNYVAKLMMETDFEGKPIRPYLFEAHPDYNNTVSLLEKFSTEFEGDPQVVPKSLAKLDQYMKAKMTEKKPPVQPQTRVPHPMQGSNLTNVNKKTTIKMSRAEMEISRKLGIDPKRYAAKRDELNTKGKK